MEEKMDSSTSWADHRLRKTWEFQKIIKGRKKVENEQFIIFFSDSLVKDNKRKKCKFGISIPQKFVKKAVLRNKYKRRVKAMINEFINNEKTFFCCFLNQNFVLIIKQHFVKRSFDENKKNLKKLFNFFKVKLKNRNKKF